MLTCQRLKFIFHDIMIHRNFREQKILLKQQRTLNFMAGKNVKPRLTFFFYYFNKASFFDSPEKLELFYKIFYCYLSE